MASSSEGASNSVEKGGAPWFNSNTVRRSNDSKGTLFLVQFRRALGGRPYGVDEHCPQTVFLK